MEGPRINWCLKQRLCIQHLWQPSSGQHQEIWQTMAELFCLIMCWKATGFYSLDSNQGHPFVAECSAFTTLLAGGLALLLCDQQKKQTKPKQKTHNTKPNKTKGHKILSPTICWSTGRGYSADPNAWLHSAGVPCDPSFHGGIQWENRLHEATPATAVNRLISLLLLQD